MSYSYLFKYIIIGDTGVGKSCLLSQFCSQKFKEKHEVTIGVEFGARMLSVQNQNIKLQIWDTAGQEQFRSITRTYYRSAAGAILVYDVTKKESFQHLQQWIKEVKEHGNEHLSLILVGNKCDLEDEREVEIEQGEKFAKEHNIEFLEVSAKTAYQVEQMFLNTANIILDKINNKIINPHEEVNFICRILEQNQEMMQDYQNQDRKNKKISTRIHANVDFIFLTVVQQNLFFKCKLKIQQLLSILTQESILKILNNLKNLNQNKTCFIEISICTKNLQKKKHWI